MAVWYNPFSWFGANLTYTSVTGIKNNIGSVGFEQVSSVMSCIKVLSDNLSKLPIVVKQDGQIMQDHRLYDLLYYSPNGWQTSQEFISTLEVNKNIHGNSFARVMRDSNGYVTGFEFIENIRVSHIQIVDGKLYYHIDGKPVLYEDVLHFKNFSKDGIVGYSPIEIAKLNWETTGKALLANKNMYDNGVLSHLYLEQTAGTTVNNAKLKEAVDSIEKDNKGVENIGKMVKIPINTTIKNFPINLEQLQFLKSIKANSEDIAAIFSVPAFMIGAGSPKYSNLGDQMADFRINTMSNITTHYEAQLESKLLTKDERKKGITLEFDFSAMMWADPKARMEINLNYHKRGILTGNQIAKAEGYDQYPEGDIRYIESNNLTSVTTESKENDKV